MKQFGMLRTAGMMLLCAMLSSGCGPNISEADVKERWDIWFYNASPDRVRDIEWQARYQEDFESNKVWRIGSVRSDGSKILIGFRVWPISQELQIKWQDPQTEERREATFNLWAAVDDPAKFKGTIFLVYTGSEDGWKVAALTHDQKRQWTLAPKGDMGGFHPPLPPEMYQGKDPSADEGGQP